jgi:WD40 repeat protein/tRNA A-37 threonylcarbamoyl transferase component Bud32
MIDVRCSGCGGALQAEDEWAGRNVKCPDCGARTPVASPSGETATLPPSAPVGDDSEIVMLARAAPVPGAAAVVTGYDILCELGRGGMGVVYKARHVKLGRLVALKMILVAEHAGPEERARFQTEAEAVARLQHPNIVQIYEVGEQDGRPFFSLEFCAGGSLEQKLAGTPLPPKEAARLAETLARAMHAAHEAGVVHRDLKPANVLLAKDGTPKITDFGLAKKLGEAGQTATGAVMGTPSYMAPEQAGGRSEDIGPRTDVYALGALLYEMLTGRPPFRAATPLDTILQVIAEEPVPVRHLQPKVPPDLETICLKCLRKEPGQRYHSAAALARDLRCYLDGKPIRARPVGVAGRAWKWVRRNPVVAGLAAAATVSLVGGTILASYFAVEARGEAARARAEKLAGDRNLYAAEISVAQRAWDDAAVARLNELLDRQRPDHTGGTDIRGFEWYYLRGLTHTGVATLHADTDVTALSFAPDGRVLFADQDGTITAWTGQERQTLLEHTGSDGAFSADGSRYAVAENPGPQQPSPIHVWDVRAGRKDLTLPGQAAGVSRLAFSADGRRLVSSGNVDVTVWDLAARKSLLAIQGAGRGDAPALSPDGTLLFTDLGKGNPQLRLCDVERRKPDLVLDWGARVYHLKAYSADGRRVAGASMGRVGVWDVRSGAEIASFSPPGTLYALAFSPDGTRLATGGADQVIRLWDAASGKALLTLRGHAAAIQHLAFGPEGKRIASVTVRTVRLWDATGSQEARTFPPPAEPLTGLTLSRDGRRLVTTSGGHKFVGNVGHALPGEIKVRDARTGEELLSIKEYAALGRGVALSPDGSRIAAPAGSGDMARDWPVKVWDAADGHLLLTLPGHSSPVSALAFSPDGRRLATGGTGTVKIWDAMSGRELRSYPRMHSYPIESLSWSPDGARLASATSGLLTPRQTYDSAVVWDTNRGNALFTLDGERIDYVTFSPDGKLLAVASAGGIDIRDSVTKDLRVALVGHKGPVVCVAFSPDGRRLFSSGDDGTLRVWDPETRHELLALKGGVGHFSVSGDDQRIAIASSDGAPGTVKVWEAPRDGD